MKEQDIDEMVLSAVADFARSLTSRSGVVPDMSDLINVTAELPLARLDRWERAMRWCFDQTLLQEKNKQPSWKFWKREKRPITWLDLSSHDGYKRERALRSLVGGAPNRFFLAIALRRLNDWVPEVRLAAREMLPKIAAQSKPEHVVDAVCVVLTHWNSWQRMDNPERSAILEIAQAGAVTRALVSKLVLTTTGPMSSILSQLGRTEMLDKFLPDIAKGAVQPTVRAKAYRSLLDTKITWFEKREFKWTDVRYSEGRFVPVVSERDLVVSLPFRTALVAASKDPSPIVRRVAGEFLIKRLTSLGASAPELAQRLANDSSPSVAERGRFALRALST